MKGQGWLAALAAIALLVVASMPLVAQDSGMVPYGAMMVKVHSVIAGGTVVIPESTIPKPPGRAHTHLMFVIPDAPLTTPFNCVSHTTCETPASLACVYGLVSQSNGCNPNVVTKLASGGSKTIAIVDAFHDKTALSDLQKFSSTFGLPAPNLEVVYCSSTTCNNVTTPPPACETSDQCGWALEESLDMQAAHAMAPKAKIILVEAHSDSNTDLYRAEVKAGQLVSAAGGGEVTNSWGGEDSAGEQSNDPDFVASGVVFFASTGDHKNNSDPPYSPDIEYPSTSPNVVGVGGTLISRASNGSFMYEAAWNDSGGGLSANEPRPSWQNVIEKQVGSHRGVPDMAADASPVSGLLIYCTPSSCGTDLPAKDFIIVGGTSLASPLVAAMTNAAGHFRSSSTSQHNELYGNLGKTSVFNLITHGTCHNGPNAAAVNASGSWNVCTGLGTPHGLSGL